MQALSALIGIGLPAKFDAKIAIFHALSRYDAGHRENESSPSSTIERGARWRCELLMSRRQSGIEKAKFIGIDAVYVCHIFSSAITD